MPSLAAIVASPVVVGRYTPLGSSWLVTPSGVITGSMVMGCTPRSWMQALREYRAAAGATTSSLCACWVSNIRIMAAKLACRAPVSADIATPLHIMGAARTRRATRLGFLGAQGVWSVPLGLDLRWCYPGLGGAHSTGTGAGEGPQAAGAFSAACGLAGAGAECGRPTGDRVALVLCCCVLADYGWRSRMQSPRRSTTVPIGKVVAMRAMSRAASAAQARVVVSAGSPARWASMYCRIVSCCATTWAVVVQ